MPPKEGEKDELDVVKGEIQAKDLQILCSNDKIARLEERAFNLGSVIKETRRQAEDRDKILEDQIAALTRDAKEFDRRSEEMEQIIETLKKERAESHAALLAELNELKTTHRIQVEAIQKELDDAHNLIQAVKEFTLRRAAIEKEIQNLKNQLSKEKKQHQEALNDVERVAQQERERLRKEMAVKIEETKLLMIKQTEEQLHVKTKRTILENEQLAKEVAYHIRQTELLVLKNGQLQHENNELEDKMLAAKELEEELARKNHSYQKASRILLFKLQEQHLAANIEAIEEMDELKHLINRNEQLKAEIQKEHQDLEKLKAAIEEKTKCAESVGAAEEAVKFLYLALEDVELEELANVDEDTSLIPEDGVDLNTPTNHLDLLPIQQRQDFLKHLLRTAISLRVMMQKAISSDTAPKGQPSVFGSWSHVLYEGQEDKPRISVEDILAFQVDTNDLDNAGPPRRVSCAIQTNDEWEPTPDSLPPANEQHSFRSSSSCIGPERKRINIVNLELHQHSSKRVFNETYSDQLA
ncbi:hypothetical protein SELMODRAFT_404282 [Selaginella moellendorffii]|uniref:Cilia- and flagella-associated protein 157 n=2 Tax=Selaginella moellendorffii TaxID=88036 RepID=D8QUU8_SELML|nr:hypothetical protein SELMODRAFT_404282 [Selaginella moellendorffii]